MKLRRVVTVFLQEPQGDRVLLGRRSTEVRTYPGHWAGISGSVENGPLRQALVELEEETGLSEGQVTWLGTGRRVRTTDWGLETRWIIHPFLFRCEQPDVLRRNWEHTRFEWKKPDAMRELSTVPELRTAYENGTLDRDTYRAKMVALASRIQQIEHRLNQSRAVAGALPEQARSAAGLDIDRVDRLREQAGEMRGGEIAEIARGIAGPNVGMGIPDSPGGPPAGVPGNWSGGPGGPGDPGPPSDDSRPNR